MKRNLMSIVMCLVVAFLAFPSGFGKNYEAAALLPDSFEFFSTLRKCLDRAAEELGLNLNCATRSNVGCPEALVAF